ncbi:MAG TPA: metallophosphoesterase [Xanthomonadales bacterium]|nr:metallophosphoesterase [Xanthomonadales bacterium]
MKYTVIPILILCLTACQTTSAEPRQIDSHTWEGVERVVAIGDIHGDYDNYMETLKSAGLVNKRGRWTGGATHLVQTGDIPDRGPDTREIMEHIDKLAEQAEKDDGRVHLLIGNHEAMNVYGDLRYVTEGEYDEFADRGSKKIQERYFELVMKDLETNDPEAFAALPENYREEWFENHPPGFVEHQQAWNPAWNPDGEYARRTQGLKAAIKINGNVFVHGGISEIYADMPLADITDRAHSELATFTIQSRGMLNDACGPFWFRGLAEDEPGDTIGTTPEVLASILDRLSAKRIVIGHTPTQGVIWPRFDARVVLIDTGISAAYGGFPAYLEIVDGDINAGYPEGKLALPRDDEARAGYLEQLLELDPDNPGVRRFINKFEESENPEPEIPGTDEEATGESAEDQVERLTCLLG